jgi:acyl dehydratase
MTSGGRYFEDFTVGEKMRHARGTTVGEVENQLLTKLVMNTAQAHFNEHAMKGGPYGERLVFGLVTGSIVIGLATPSWGSTSCASPRPSSTAIPCTPIPKCSPPNPRTTARTLASCASSTGA